MKPNNLTDKQRRFCEEYCIDYNGTRAAIAAGYSEKGARTEGSRLLANANIQNYISERQTNLSEACGISALAVALHYKRLAQNEDERIQLQALKGIREMLGFDAPRRKEISGPDGGAIQHSYHLPEYTDGEVMELAEQVALYRKQMGED
jgi:hypothetical protein